MERGDSRLSRASRDASNPSQSAERRRGPDYVLASGDLKDSGGPLVKRPFANEP